MASTSSSTKKAAKLAQKGKGKRVRFQGGTIFPLAVAATLILGLALIVYGRQTLPAADSSPPTINDHWHAAYGFYLCDTWYQLDGDLEERDSRGQFTNTNFVRSGIHSHNDGIIHWHPYNSRGVGRNAVLGVFLETYDVKLENDKITFPPQNALGGQEVWDEDETQCNGEDAEVSVRAWGSFTDTDGGTKYISNMDEIHIDNDQMVFAIYFTAKDEPQVMPPWAQQLPTLGAIDSGQILPEAGDLESLLENDDNPGTTEDSGDTTEVTEDSGDTTDTSDDQVSTDDSVSDDTETDTSDSSDG